MPTLEELAAYQVNSPGHRTFDWDKAAELILRSEVPYATAGLLEDWFWTGGDIFRDFKPVPRDDTYVYLASTWATPALQLGNADPIPCYTFTDEDPDQAHTYWPASALAILSGQ